MDGYLRAVEAWRPGKECVVSAHLDQLDTDICDRFLQTVGMHRSLRVLAESLPMSGSADVNAVRAAAIGLAKKAALDYGNINSVFIWYHQDDYSAEKTCRNIKRWCELAMERRRRLIASIDSLRDKGVAVTIMKTALRQVVEKARLEYELLAEQCDDFLRQLERAAMHKARRRGDAPDMDAIAALAA
jgi:hypothetical protein